MAEHEEARTKALDSLSSEGWTRLLVNACAVEPLSVREDFEFTSDHAMQFDPRIRTAIIHSADEAERFRFIENVATNRGVQMRAFLEESEALDWLLDVVD